MKPAINVSTRVINQKCGHQFAYFKPLNRNKGCNLIELMIVIAIIALLTTLAIPSYSNYIDRKDNALARIDIDGIEQAILRFSVTTGRLPDNLTMLGMNNLLDPWGQPYEHLNHDAVQGNGKFRKFKSEVPLNSDDDLYSINKNGASNGPLTAATSKDDLSVRPMAYLSGSVLTMTQLILAALARINN